ncbi:MAG: DUF1178 family protein [Rhodospirillales bacterium]|nr:DUF1178 family protein [Rhodospirillales bacterium]
MILYQLKCHKGHNFEAWFRDGATYDTQSVSGDVSCPLCGNTEVAKAPMAPNLASRNRSITRPLGGGDEARAQEVAAKILEAVDGLRQEVEDTCEYVGDDFADEARAIQFGETEERGIYGKATDEEAEELEEEGVDFFRFPFPRRRND